MCGIVGILGRSPVAEQLVDSLKRLEYRGYDSAGVATLEAIPAPNRRRLRAHAGGGGRGALARAPRQSAPRTITVARSVHAGRSAIALTHLRRGRVYVLRLTVTCAEGQLARSSAALRVASR